MSDLSLTARHTSPVPQSSRSVLRGIGAILLTILHAGLGQALNRQWKKAIAFAVAVPCLAIAAGQVRLLNTPLGLAIWFGLTFGLLLTASIDAFRDARRNISTKILRARPLILAFALIVVMNVAVYFTDFYFDHIMGFRAVKIPSRSMLPTLQLEDRIVVDMWHFRTNAPQRGEMVIFDNAKLPARADGTFTRFLHRVIAIGGDNLEIRNGRTFINEAPVDEPYVLAQDSNSENDFGPITVPPEHVFVMGDNRANSYDSRYWSFLPVEYLRGRPLYVYWSNDRSRIGKRLQ